MALAFDFGFTLARDVESPSACLRAALELSGVGLGARRIESREPSRAQVSAALNAHQGLLDEATWNAIFDGIYASWIAGLHTGLSPEAQAETARIARQRYERAANWTPDPHAQRVLELCRSRGYRLGLLSNWGCGLSETLDSFGWEGVFNASLSCIDLGYAKPHPRAFRSLCRALGVSPGHCLYVGDDPETDAAGARAAGLRAYCLEPTPTPLLDLVELLASGRLRSLEVAHGSA